MWAVELRREESRGRLEDLVGPAQLRVLLLQRLQLLRLRGRRPGPDTGVHLRLPHPLAQRLRSRDPQLRRDRPNRLVLRGIVLTVLPHQRDRALTQLRRVLRGTCHETSSFQTNEVSRHPGAAQSSQLARRAPLGVAMLGFFVVALDAQIVNVALPATGAHLGGGLSGLQWVVTGYTLTFSSLLLFAGTLSDRIGARRGYGLGMAVFVAASVVCGLAPSLPVLVGARVAQGVGAALISPTSLAMIREAYADARERAKAVACGRWAGRSRQPPARSSAGC